MSDHTPANVDGDCLISDVAIVRGRVGDLHDVSLGLSIVISVDCHYIARSREEIWEGGAVFDHRRDRCRLVTIEIDIDVTGADLGTGGL